MDEYQDINNVQREIVELLCQGKNNITVVGDDSQSIYSFRGANFENILRFPVSFHDYRAVKIEQNYRSGQGILDFANSIIDNTKIVIPTGSELVNIMGEMAGIIPFEKK